ncbi:TIR domain-containing protein [Lysobacter antibioticus]|uniref:TIR domain-containing protein n=1 Tax=Lysobacter antibioticus TaxID=84531 RepID=UPI0009DDDB2F|nr:TIR domain-containing protein [Lysobacter antibioticus]
MERLPTSTSVPNAAPLEESLAERYDVFISYSRKDIQFVARLERALEAYKPPSSLPLERRRLRVFRDAQDLTGPEYGVSIRDNLRRSKRLLVVCSPNARQSAFVDQEIEWFLETHENADVISLLLDGVPNNEADAVDPRCAFPAQLCKAHAIPLAADYRGFDVASNKPPKAPFAGAWYTLLANIYGIDRNKLEERERLRQRRERRIAIAITGVVMASLAGAAVFSWVQMKRAEEQRDVAVRGFARSLAMQSEDEREVNKERALLLAVEAARATHDVDGTLTDDAELALRRVLAEAGGTRLGIDTRGLSFSADGRWLARYDDDGKVTVWDLRASESKSRELTLPALPNDKASGSEGGRLSAAIFGPQHRLALITKDRDRFAVVDVQEPRRGKPRWLTPRVGRIRHLEFSHDGTALLLVDDSPDLALHEVADLTAPPTLLRGHAAKSVDGEMRGIATAAFGSTGRWIVTSGWDETVLLWDRKAIDAAPHKLLTGVIATAPVFSADDRWLVVATQSAPHVLWSLGDDAPRAVAMASTPGETAPGAALSFDAPSSAFMTGDHLIAAGGGETLVWKLSPTGAQIERRIPESLAALGGDGRHFVTTRVAGGQPPDYIMSLWNVEASAEAKAEERVNAPIHAVGYSARGRRLAALTDAQELWVWDLTSDFESSDARRYLGAKGNKLVMSADGHAVVIGDWSSEARLWMLTNPSLDPLRVSDVEDDAELEQRMTSGSSSSSRSGQPFGGLQQMLAFDRDAARVAMPRQGGALAIVTLARPNRAPVTIPVHEDGVSAVAFSPDGKLVAAGDKDLTIRLWRNGEHDKPMATLRIPSAEGAASSVSVLTFSHSGQRLAAGGAFGAVAVWDVSNLAAEPLTLAGQEDWVTSLEFSPDDGSLLVATDSGAASVVALSKPVSVRALKGHTGFIWGAFIADGEAVVTAGMDGSIRVWSMRDAKAEPRILQGHIDTITTLALVPGKQRLITASEDGWLRVWNLASGDQPEKAIALRVPLSIITVSHDGQWLALADRAGNVQLLRMATLDAVGKEFPLAWPGREEDRAGLYALKFSPDDRWLAALLPGEGRVWRLDGGELIRLACEASGRNLDVEEWEKYLGELEYRFTCPEWGLGPGYLEHARRDAKRGHLDNAVRLLTRAKALVPELPFEPAAEARRIGIAGVLERGRDLVRDGRSDTALAELGRVRQIDPGTSFDPAQEIERVKKAGKLVVQADAQASIGELDGATAKYREALVLDPGLDIDPGKQASKIYAPILVQEGEEFARQGHMEEAIARFERAEQLDSKALWRTPEETAGSVRADVLIAEAGKLADGGDLQGAIAGYRAAMVLDEKRGIDPEAEAAKRVATYWLEQAYRSGEFPGAIELFEKGRSLDATVKVDSFSANGLCWAAVKRGYAKRVMAICNAAVSSDAANWMARDSRGVARVLAGDTAGAISDFEAYVRAGDRPDVVAQRKRWIARLKAGWRPRSFQELDRG